MVGNRSIVKSDPNINRHIVPEVLVSSDEYIAIGILEIEASGISLVEPVKVLDSGDDGVRGIVRKDLHLQWKPSPIICGAIEEQLKCDCLGYRTSCRGLIPRRGGMETSTLTHCRILMVHCEGIT